MQPFEFNLFLFGTLFKGGKCLIKISIYAKFQFQMIWVLSSYLSDVCTQFTVGRGWMNLSFRIFLLQW